MDQCPFVLGLSSENGELLLDECVQVTEDAKTRERHLFLFSDVLIFAKLKSDASYRLKHRVSLGDIWLYNFEEDPEDKERGGDVDLRITLMLAWALTFCMVSFSSPEVKERWLDTLHSKVREARAKVGCTTPPPSVLMKVLSGTIATKTLTGGAMEPFMEFAFNDNAKISALSEPLHNPEDQVVQPIEGSSKWNLLRKLRRGSGFVQVQVRVQLFGQPLCKICPDDSSLPKPVTDMLVLLWKRGPSTEGVFRKPANSKTMRIIKDQLNSHQDVDMEDLPVVLLVGLLKSFLKELPGSLLVSELYDTWIKALDTEGNLQRASEVRRVVQELPALNRLLLQRLLRVLHHILQNSDTNKMDARNLAVCIAPTLLQLDSTPLDQQKDKLDKVTELTQFLIENCRELLGENALTALGDADEDNSDSLCSQQHDSAYDSTDPEADAGSTEGSVPSLPYSCTAIPTCPSDTIFHTFTKPAFNRRCSEPIIFPSAEIKSLHGLTRSHDDCSLQRRDFEPLKKQISNDSVLLARHDEEGSALSFQKLGRSMASYTLGNPTTSPSKDCSRSSSCSLESAASNQSDSSVFTCSPQASPTCPRRALSDHQAPFSDMSRIDSSRMSDPQVQKHSQCMRIESKVPVRTRSLGAFSLNRGSHKKGETQKGKPFPCGTLKEDSQSEAETPSQTLLRPRPLSAIDVFQQQLSSPPSYEQAVLSAGLLAPSNYSSMTVHNARELGKRSRPVSVHEDLLSLCPVNQYTDCFHQGLEDQVGLVERRLPFRPRTQSESVSRGHREVSRRCSQPVFEECSYAKESYV